ELAGGSRAIDTEVRMMDDARVAGPELQRPHISRTGQRNRDHEGSKDVRATGRHGVRRGRAGHAIADTRPPAVLPGRHPRTIRAVSLLKVRRGCAAAGDAASPNTTNANRRRSPCRATLSAM